MSWQDDLRRLDADLAAGRLEPAVHRKQRDELLAQASGSTVPSPVPSPLRRPGGNTWHSANPAYGQPEQPPHRLQAPQPRSEMPPVNPARPAPPPYRQAAQQTPPPPATGKTLSGGQPPVPDYLTTAPSPADINPTRYLSVDGQSGSPSRFPPLAPDPGRPGPQFPPGRHRWDDEIPAPPSRSKPTWLFLTLGVLLAVALVAAGTWWMSDNSGDTASGSSGPPAPANALDPGLTLEGRLPLLPGTQSTDNSTMTIAKALEKKAVTKADADLITAIGGNEIIYRATSDPANVDNGTLLLAIPTPSMIQAKQLVSGLRQNLVDAGFTAASLAPGEDLAFTRHNDDGWVSALWYASGPVVIGLGVSQPHSADPAPLRPRLEQILDLARKTMPVG